VHRTLTLTTIVFEQPGSSLPLVLMSADLMSWRSKASEDAVIGEILRRTNLPRQNLMLCLTHTHAAPSIRSEDVGKTGGHLIEGFQKWVVKAAVESIAEARGCARDAIVSWRYGKCDLATNRDLPEPAHSSRLRLRKSKSSQDVIGEAASGEEEQQDRSHSDERIVCGFNPEVPADDTLLVGRICDTSRKIVATIVNYACHPTTLAWENRLISPDWVGAMRETVEQHTDAPCLFLQGASGELAPAEQYVTDTAIADRHGRRGGFAAMSMLEAMDPPGVQLSYDGVVESGAALAVWRNRPVRVSDAITAHQIDVELPLKPMPQIAETDDPMMKQRIERQLAVRSIVGTGATAKMPLWVWRIGDAVLVGQPNEAYSMFQIQLREHFAPRPVAVMNLVNGSAGYLAPRELYEREIYQVWQSPFARGSLEILTKAAREAIGSLFDNS
jgi:hypothetical protein